MPVTEKDVRHIAALARLGLEEARVPALAAELSTILDHMAVLERVRTDGVELAVGVGSGGTPLREDTGPPIPLAVRQEAFAPSVRDGFFLVPRLATHEGLGTDPVTDDAEDREALADELKRGLPERPGERRVSENLLNVPASHLRDRVAANEVNAEDAVRAAFARARDVGAGRDGLNLLLYTDEQRALGDARAVGASVHRTGERADEVAGLAMAGVAVAVKDNIATLTMPTTCGSRVLGDYVSPYEATVVTRLRNAGAVVIAKTNMDEFAMGSSTENSAFGAALNPVDRTRVPGGSSGGSAGAVAAGVVRVALGSETGGSVRQPAAFCGIVGVKPTYGRVSRYGLVAFASSLDQVGVFGRTVDDAALGLETIAGPDPLDSTAAPIPVAHYRGARMKAGDLAGLVVGRPKEYFPDELDPRLRERCDAALEALRARGATVKDVSLPHTALAIPTYYIVAPAEASSNLARFDGTRYGLRIEGDGLAGMYEATRSRGFGREVTRRILLGTYVLSAGYYDAYYKKAMAVRSLIAEDFSTVFAAGAHVLFTPTTPSPAFALGAKSDPYEMYLSDIFTATANLAGVPAMSVPIGRVDGLPVGGQFIAAHFDEHTMFRAAFALEAALGGEAHR